jgi:hypothetical protein
MPPPPARPAAPLSPQHAKPNGTADVRESQRTGGSLLKAKAQAERSQPHKSAAEKAAEEEREMMAAMLKKQALRSVQENATGIVQADPVYTGWTPPSWCEFAGHVNLTMSGCFVGACRNYV